MASYGSIKSNTSSVQVLATFWYTPSLSAVPSLARGDEQTGHDRMNEKRGRVALLTLDIDKGTNDRPLYRN